VTYSNALFALLVREPGETTNTSIRTASLWHKNETRGIPKLKMSGNHWTVPFGKMFRDI
jgi:hypothetical protein